MSLSREYVYALYPLGVKDYHNYSYIEIFNNLNDAIQYRKNNNLKVDIIEFILEHNYIINERNIYSE